MWDKVFGLLLRGLCEFMAFSGFVLWVMRIIEFCLRGRRPF